MKVKESINKAIKGGWLKKQFNLEVVNFRLHFLCYHDLVEITWINLDNKPKDRKEQTTKYSLDWIVLQPDFWKAIGKVEGWKSTGLWKEPRHIELFEWMLKMDGLMPHLQEGGSIESYLKTL